MGLVQHATPNLNRHVGVQHITSNLGPRTGL